MSAPTPLVRRDTYKRDLHRCVSCGIASHLQYQHRAADGMGGRLARPLLDEGCTSCATCNPRYESSLQTLALRYGWKVRRWVVDRGIAYRVPVFVAWERTWYLLSRDGGRMAISVARARALMDEVYGPEYEEWAA